MKSAKYAQQAEYRLIWLVNGIASPFLDIMAPEARQFCTPPPGVEVVPVATPEQVLRDREMTPEEFESQLEPGTFKKVLPRSPEAAAEEGS